MLRLSDPLTLIVVGELLIADDTRAALDAATKGHLVLTTSHAGSTTDALQSVVGTFLPAEQSRAAGRLAASIQASSSSICFHPPKGGIQAGSNARSTTSRLLGRRLQEAAAAVNAAGNPHTWVSGFSSSELSSRVGVDCSSVAGVRPDGGGWLGAEAGRPLVAAEAKRQSRGRRVRHLLRSRASCTTQGRNHNAWTRGVVGQSRPVAGFVPRRRARAHGPDGRACRAARRIFRYRRHRRRSG